MTAVPLTAAPLTGCSGSWGDFETNDDGPGYGSFEAFVIGAFIPVLAIFAAFQRGFIAAGLTSGGVKA